ncbi:MAG TPA: aminoacyl-tRNA hydrolase [Blastocatellia bacterium]|nr:aminoacyl-tRNA hydrolase [Blastocatellia bacterium]
MFLIVGLGNPGEKYERTRHNCGFLVIDELARRAGRELRTPECQSLTTKANLVGEAAILVKPQTFMNLSGVAVAALMKKHEIKADHLLIISDEAALPLGKLRLRGEGSAGGQNGLKSIIKEIGTQAFARLRIGIAPDHPVRNLSDFVLGEFSKSEREIVDETIVKAADAVEVFLQDGIAAAMSKYN